ncbi:putative toll-Interleukin receptor [Sphingobacterium sp. PM2-P1-29]|nr:putative toll-Interleukin receptor [Sphingobacterium sp. PM2-P1-29]
MKYFNKVELRAIPQMKIFSTSLKRVLNEAKLDEQFDIFLSHSYVDKDLIMALYTDLTERGFRVYVDWLIDPDLNRSVVTKDTAEVIRTRLNNSKSLVIAVSENSSINKWIPWELGYADGHCGKCCILPMMEEQHSKKDFHGSEYLKLYPQIKKQISLGGGDTLYVEENQNKKTFRIYLRE